jgi:hypothetical protein
LQGNSVDTSAQVFTGSVSLYRPFRKKHAEVEVLIHARDWYSFTGMTTVAGSALLSISIALNAISLHGTCTAVFVAVATIVVFLLASIQTLEQVAWITWSGAASLVISC